MVNEPFTASNGVTLQPRETLIDWRMEDLGGVLNFNIDTFVDDALAEWYQHRRDVELGRWRSKEHPNYVVYPVAEWPDAIDIMDESTTTSHRCAPDCFHLGEETFKWGAVKAEYFAANPEKKPWHGAKPGEVWVLETKHHPEPRAFKVSSRRGHFTSSFTQVYSGQPLYTPKDGPITAGYRIWPDDTCKHPETWFSRELCPPPCDSMHDICEDCTWPADGCPFNPPGTYNAFAKESHDES